MRRTLAWTSFACTYILGFRSKIQYPRIRPRKPEFTLSKSAISPVFKKKIKKMNLNQITLPVTSVPSSIPFYEKLGLKLIVHTHDAYARFECPSSDSTLSLHQVERAPPSPGSSPTAVEPPTRSRDDGVWVYFEVEDVDGKVKELEAKGIEIEQQPVDQKWLWREARLRDADGNVIIIYHAGENRKNPPWRKKD
jgi:catechol 2,3-dioxygenase-like lactoylglutathione lyase family enzyme